MERKNYLVSYYYWNSFDTLIALQPSSEGLERLDNVTEGEVNNFVRGLQIALGDRLQNKIMVEEII